MSGAAPRRLAYLALEAPVPGQAAHTHVHEMIRGLRGLGWEVTPFLAERSGAAQRRPMHQRLLEHARVQRALVARMAEFDALYMRSHPLALPAAIMARRRGLKVAQEINGVPTDVGVTYPWLRPALGALRWMQARQYRLADALLPVTPGLVDWAKAEAPGVAVHLVANAANLDLFRADGPRFAHPRPYAVFVGGLVAWHGIPTMLEALRDPAWPEGVDLLVAGDGVERERLASGGPRLHWLKRVEQAEVPALLRGALAALVPIGNPAGRSSTGVLPLKLYEAMACGAPVIATDLPAQADLIRAEGAGLIVPVGDAAALAQAVARLHADPSLAACLGAAGAQAAAARHGWAHRAAEVDAILTGLLAR